MTTPRDDINWDNLQSEPGYKLARQQGYEALREWLWRLVASARSRQEHIYEFRALYELARHALGNVKDADLQEAAQLLVELPSPSAQLSAYVAEWAIDTSLAPELALALIIRGYHAACTTVSECDVDGLTACMVDCVRLAILEVRATSLMPDQDVLRRDSLARLLRILEMPLDATAGLAEALDLHAKLGGNKSTIAAIRRHEKARNSKGKRVGQT